MDALGPENLSTLRKGVRLWRFINVVFECDLDHDQVVGRGRL